ncbi:hypothetical protein [Brevibacillus laterosporus]|uniref:hypothetical protein n=1 Tax=Brevibacillus laterosporus TaxID=1465 RepID=UPI000E6D5A2F|nr:hypothetical protein [Brevibacillus laterosporus]AYB37648.1 hypothetical protein D5F52_04750 [Brevibacillus laterosporus]MBM7110897.1 hypothetical protein [Brevibacillus laterosporus]
MKQKSTNKKCNDDFKRPIVELYHSGQKVKSLSSEYVIYLSSEEKPKDMNNSYGYWEGKTYTFGGILIPVTGNRINGNTKRYKSKQRAKNMAEKLGDRCGYVLSWVVDEI